MYLSVNHDLWWTLLKSLLGINVWQNVVLNVTQSVTGTLVTPAIKFDIKVMTCMFSCHFSGVKQSISYACKSQGACQVNTTIVIIIFTSLSGETESDQININYCF